MTEILLGNIRGPEGKQGIQGEQGKQGVAGKDGEKGEQGKQGLTPKLRLEENGDLYVDYVEEV